MAERDFRKAVRNYVDGVFSSTEGWVIEEKQGEGGKHDIVMMRRPRALAVGVIVAQGPVSKKIVEEAEALRDMNKGYLAIVYTNAGARVEPDADSYATRTGVRIIKLG